MKHESPVPFIRDYPTGSRYICPGAARETSDDDVVIQVAPKDFALAVELAGVQAPRYAGGFVSLRDGRRNWIVVEDDETFDRWVAATEVARLLHLRDRRDRAALFQAVLYGRVHSPAERLQSFDASKPQ